MIVVNFLSYVMMWLMSSTLNIAIVRYIIGFSLPIRVVIAFRCKMNTSPPPFIIILQQRAKMYHMYLKSTCPPFSCLASI